ncbi:carbamoyl-phosphate synthase, small subunit [Gottschalkia acidurici 9a]|uniref:Carbamoyl phosphate synthase small chain n=1 Tax=Gottschalkia acidurici (strain ATCC 7906 / DSM 604 / BCRC 14475 / CIP 104303 / KCTC 5404 / NCIMB 10678 / 9a) TaxID=1128398 RepID=K0AZV3_GOTA9|nr:glutamine-hydrolyzing carbamoyl-phosphate synthase small subunit [Gottschalkia acidurici]AFS79328.1 carbamoyl-phosphate synthase, small subunit [Gottschalkia acidurici 9a]
MSGIIYLEDGTIYVGKGFGYTGTSVGEIVFNTAMTGYQEVLTDPSYAGQVVTMTYPLIGNYGINKNEKESEGIFAKGFIVKNVCNTPSNYMSEGTLDELLKEMKIVGVYDVDTRSITKKVRSLGSVKCVITNEDLKIGDLEKLIKETKIDDNWVEKVSIAEKIHIPGDGNKVAVIDCGAKGNIINCLQKKACDVTVFPYGVSYEELMSINPDGVLISNGPGNPKAASKVIPVIQKLMEEKVPTFGICLGHQLISLAVGGDTYKMKYGHRGGNHGVYDIDTDRAYITSQNHGYSVDAESVKSKGMVITHINLNDETVEGMKHENLPIFSVQFHPEGAPGPDDSEYLFDKFIDMMKEGK